MRGLLWAILCFLVGCGGNSSAPGQEVDSDLGAFPRDGQSSAGDITGASQEIAGSVCEAVAENVGEPGIWAAAIVDEFTQSSDIPTQITDEAITLHVRDKRGNDTAHRVHKPGKPSGRLFLFFPGTNSTPQQYALLLSVAAEQGYHVIGLVYANQLSVNGTCKSSEDECACLGNMRLEILTGTDTSSDLAVGLADSVDNRLVKLLEYLVAQEPGDGWDTFLDDSGAVRWDKVTLSGHSQGGGHAALMAQRYEVARAVFFSSPADNCKKEGNIALPDWAQWPMKTPSNRLFGLSHLREKGRDNHQMNWDSLGMISSGCLVDVDSSFPPYGNTQILVTGLDPASGPCPTSGVCDAAHGATVADTPMDAENKPVLLPAWRYLMEVPAP